MHGSEKLVFTATWGDIHSLVTAFKELEGNA
jgi:hypothetical protein